MKSTRGLEPRRPDGVPPCAFCNFTTHRGNKVKILSKKVRDTQANARYSAKNNVAIRMIATFMPTYLSLFTGEIHDREGDSYFIPAFTKYSYFISTHLSMLVVHSGVYCSHSFQLVKVLHHLLIRSYFHESKITLPTFFFAKIKQKSHPQSRFFFLNFPRHRPFLAHFLQKKNLTRFLSKIPYYSDLQFQKILIKK